MRIDQLKKETVNAKPFLKWAGGKTQLVGELSKRLPKHILSTMNIDMIGMLNHLLGEGLCSFF